MKTNFKFKILWVFTGLMLSYTPTLLAQDPTDVVGAITAMKKEVIKALNNTTQTSIVDQLKAINIQMTTLFDDTFKGTFNPSTGKMEEVGTIDDKITLYAQNFYSLYSTKDFSSMNFMEKSDENEEALQKLQAQILGYNLQQSISTKINDGKALLAEPIENGSNNIDRASLGLNPDPEKDKSTSPYGSLNSNSPIESNAPNIESLIGPDKYTDQKMQNKAKLFISYILQAVPASKNISIPSKAEAVNNKVTIQLPYASQDLPYTSIEISTKASSSGSGSDLDNMEKFLKRNPLFQEFKAKMRANNILRSLYLQGLISSYQARTIDFDKKDDKSLVEREREAAIAGLDKQYYEDLKKMTVADVNLEILYSIKTLNYFLWKLHQDNELNALVIGASGMRLTAADMQEEMQYLKPIGALIANRCWDLESDATDERKQACSNPAMAAYMPKQ
ncbi:MAG: hypothetical protein KKE11_03440 [Gammaproteobacteria bacterium]|nr:hypothetical protein [Gammaproteobacteria bacterium]